MGEHDLDSNKDCVNKYCADDHIDFKIESTTIHELYTGPNSAQPNDIALLRLASEVVFTGCKRFF